MSAANQNDKDGQFLLGGMYANGITTPKNYEKAYYWFLKSAEQGDTGAQLNIANMYENGIGIEKISNKQCIGIKKLLNKGVQKLRKS